MRDPGEGIRGKLLLSSLISNLQKHAMYKLNLCQKHQHFSIYHFHFPVLIPSLFSLYDASCSCFMQA